MTCDLLPKRNAEILRSRKYDRYHLGCNLVLVRGWLNIDFLPNSPSPTGEFYVEPLSSDKTYYFLNWDLSEGLPADDNTLEFVYHSHFLEHITYRQGLSLLQQIYAALKPGGRQRIVVPDLEVYCKAYLQKNDEFLDRYKNSEPNLQIGLHETRGSIFVSQLYEHGHKMGWDFETLQWALSKIGFQNIRRTECRETDFPDIDKLEICDDFRVSESLFVECEK